MLGLVDLSRKLDQGRLTSRALVEGCLARVRDPGGEGAQTYLGLYPDQALARADAIDTARKRGWSVPPFSGIPVSIKDLFDVQGETTRAGSMVLEHEPPAARDAVVVGRLRAAGLVVIGKTNMTEFAYSGLGINPHFGTPLAPFQRERGRIPGGSTSGGAVSVADEMAAAAIGTDTGGSCRIPAAFCAVVGFKPTSARVPTGGTIPLARSLDSVGPLARSVSCAAVLDSILAGGAGADVESFPAAGLRLAVLEGPVTEGMDEAVSRTYAAALTRLSRAGARLAPLTVRELDLVGEINRHGGLVAAEAYAWHREHLARAPDRYDPWVRIRLEAGRAQTAAHYIGARERREEMIRSVAERTEPFDAVICPTVVIIAPQLEALADPAISNRTDMLVLRNTSIANFLDRPAVSIPCHRPGDAPVGIMLMGHHGQDRRLLSIARGIEFTVRAGGPSP